VREYVQDGMSFEDATRKVAETTVFTTHTPVPAGHDIFPPEMIDRYFSQYWPQLGIDREQFLELGRHGDNPGFNFTALSMRLADHRNGVSEKHGEVSRSMWYDVFEDAQPDNAPIDSITNGVHLRTWISPVMREVYKKYMPRYWREQQEKEFVWDTIQNIPDNEFWSAHQQAKQQLLAEMDERARARYAEGQFDAWQVLSSGPFQNPNVLTL